MLICAPSNAACDNIGLKLSGHCKKNDMIRIQAESIDWKLVPQKLLPYCNIKESTYQNVKGGDLKGYKIIITTLILCGK